MIHSSLCLIYYFSNENNKTTESFLLLSDYTETKNKLGKFFLVEVHNPSKLIGHFRVRLSLSFKASLSAKFLL